MKRWLWLLLLPILVAAAGWWRAESIYLDVGDKRDGQYLEGFHALEGEGAASGRWTEPVALVRISLPNRLTALVLQAAVAPSIPSVSVGVNEGVVTLPRPEQAAVTNAPVPRWYAVLLPPPGVWRTDTEIHFASANIPASATDPRPIGLFVQDVELAALGAGTIMPPLEIIVVLLLLTGMITLLWYLAAGSIGVAIIVASAVGTALATAWGWQRIWVDPFLWPLLLGLGWLAGIVLLIKRPARSMLETPAVLGLLIAASSGILLRMVMQADWRWSWHVLALAGVPLALVLAHGTPRWRSVAAGVLVAVALLFAVNQYAGLWAKDWASDFAALFRGPRALWRGEPLYDLPAIRANPFGNSYKYPPFFAFAMGPFTVLPPGTAFQTWKAFLVGLLLIAAVVMWSAETRCWKCWSTLWLVVLLAFFQPIIDSIRYGQVDALLLGLLAGVLWGIRRQRWMIVGVLLAVATLIKLYPAYLLLVLLHPIVASQQRYRCLAGFAAGLALLTTASVAVFGSAVHLQYLRDVFPISGGGTAWVENQTINGLLNRLFEPSSIALVPERSDSIRRATYLAALAVTALLVTRLRSLSIGLAYSLAIISMLIILPAAWIHYQLILLIPLYVLIVEIEQRGYVEWSRAVPLALAWSLLCFGNQWTFYDRTLHGPFWQLILSYKLYGLIALWAVLAYPAAGVAPQRVAMRHVPSGSV